ncbi:MAG: bifunctional diguanylate cyclase/phosphodiesterase [Kordiimonadaceae bacterium]|nr:bifunctional diguanylate cyclase/phosphodiesterase [Kordiimonadaceae bacterium]
MAGKSGASPFLFLNQKPTLTSRSKSYDVSSPINDGIAIINVEGEDSFRLISANEVFLQALPSEGQNPIGKYINMLIWGDNVDDNKLQSHLEKTLVEKKPLAYIWQLSIGGEKKNLLCKIIPLRTKEGDIAQITISTSDFDDNENLEIEVSRYNYYDELTGLPNRFKFYEELEKLLFEINSTRDGFFDRKSIEGAVLFVNVRKLQRINESYGYEKGDDALQAVANILQETIQEHSILARFADDQFVIFLSGRYFENVKREAETLAKSIHHNFSTRTTVSKNDPRISVSVGIATGLVNAKTIEQLIQHAHLAMKRNKNISANQTVIFNPDLKTQAATKLRLETEFREALVADALELNYQPVINLQNGLISGFEALARWNNSERGSISPLEFIALAEEAGLIIPLGEWALTTACKDLKSWIDDNLLASSLFMAVNVSSSHIIAGNIVALTRDALAKSGLDGSNLKLELTESTIMENSDIARNILLDLKTYGLSLAVDDFGTGYSSLSYLSRIPADTIKIDRSFTGMLDSNQEGNNIIKVIIDLAKSLGMTIIAEGIETKAQMQKLKELGCHYGQGFLFSKAMSADKIPDLINDQPFKKMIK